MGKVSGPAPVTAFSALSYRVNFIRHPWNSSNGFPEVKRFCILPTEMENINVMDCLLQTVWVYSLFPQ